MMHELMSHTLTPLARQQTHASENITFPQLLLRAVETQISTFSFNLIRLVSWVVNLDQIQTKV